MRLVGNYIKCIHRIRITILKINKLVWCHAWIMMWWNVLMRLWWHACMRVWGNTWIRTTRIILMTVFSLQTPWYIFFREPLINNVYSTMVIWKYFAGLRHIYTSLLITNIKPQWPYNLTWKTGGRGDGMRPISTFPITINTLCVIVEVQMSHLLRNISMYSIIKPNITSYIVMKTIINTTRINRHTKQSTMVTLVMGGRVADLGPVYNW